MKKLMLTVALLWVASSLYAVSPAIDNEGLMSEEPPRLHTFVPVPVLACPVMELLLESSADVDLVPLANISCLADCGEDRRECVASGQSGPSCYAEWQGCIARCN